MHPRSRHWHLIDYAIIRHSDLADVLDTRVMRGAECETDHQFVVTKLRMQLERKQRHQSIKSTRLDVAALLNTETQVRIQASFSRKLEERHQDEPSSLEDEWMTLRDTVWESAAETLGRKKCTNKDWFVTHHEQIEPIIAARDDAKRKDIPSIAQFVPRKRH